MHVDERSAGAGAVDTAGQASHASGSASAPARLIARLAPYAGPLVVAGGALAATAYVAFVDPNEPGHFPLCPLKEVTGLDCPGCGGLRAVHALLHGDLGTALDQNLFVVLVVLPLAVVMWVGWVLRSRPGRAGPAAVPITAPPVPASGPLRAAWQRWSPYAFLALMLIFTVVRNLPGVPFLRSGIG